MDPITPQGIFVAFNAPILSASDAEVKEIKVLHSLQYVVNISSDTYRCSMNQDWQLQKGLPSRKLIVWVGLLSGTHVLTSCVEVIVRTQR